jgi:murein DD-endopeptidase MepM/ murein hydrolase activator NlpD
MCLGGLLAQLLAPTIGRCSPGETSLTGARLVKERLDQMEQAPKSAKPNMKVYVIQPGDNLCSILEKAGIAKKDALYISRKADRAYKLRKMRSGTTLELYFSPDNAGLQEVDYNVSSMKKVILYNGRVINLVKAPSQAQASVSREQLHKAGPSPAWICAPQAKNLEPDAPASNIKLFSSYNYGLPHDVQDAPEDQYEMLANGQVLSPLLPSPDSDRANSNIKERPSTKHHKNTAARNKRHVHAAKSDQDCFLKAPLAYRRVTSGFSYDRINPITNVEQPHLGIDYSAPTGTPVHSIGPGKVLFYGWGGGYGKTVRIMHNNGYVSQYAHLSRFVRGITPGKRVRKGETIGYVGMTGLATGPHLDFRIVYRGSFINPVKVEGGTGRISSKGDTGKTHRASKG